MLSWQRTGILVAGLLAVFAATYGAAQTVPATLSPEALKEIAQVEAEIERVEAQTLERLAAPPDNQVQQIELLGAIR